jgi:hypothetical protein
MRWDKTYQLGVVVRDLDTARLHFERAGIADFREGPSRAALDRQVYGRPAPDVEVRCLLAQMGPVELELLQPMRGNSVQGEALRARGEHALHVCAYTDDIASEIEAMATAGFQVISSGRFSDGGRFAYFDTRAIGGLILELFEAGPETR